MDVAQHFANLARNLEVSRLPDGKGSYRQAKADEFMLMFVENGLVYFKHRNTRQYVSQMFSGAGFTVNGTNYDGGVYALSDAEFEALMAS